MSDTIKNNNSNNRNMLENVRKAWKLKTYMRKLKGCTSRRKMIEAFADINDIPEYERPAWIAGFEKEMDVLGIKEEIDYAHAMQLQEELMKLNIRKKVD